MRWGIRKPSIRGRIAARTSWKRAVRHRLGVKAPRGWGWLTNPRRALYNRIYHRTTISVDKILRPGSRSGCLVLLAMVGAMCVCIVILCR